MMKLVTVEDYIRLATTVFSKSCLFYGHGTTSAVEEAILLVSNIINYPLNKLNLFLNSKLTDEEIQKLLNFIQTRIDTNIPLVYLTNNIWYHGYKFYIDRRVIIPRSPLGFILIKHIKRLINIYPKYILDLGTGSGCLGIITSFIYPNAIVDATDISTKALEVAEFNINSYNLGDRVIPIYSNLFDRLMKNIYDLIIINPPYLSLKEYNYLPKEYLYEPRISLVGKNYYQNLKTIINVFENGYRYLTNKGFLICEIGNIKNYNQIKKYYPIIIKNSKCILFKTKIDDTYILICNKKQMRIISRNI